MLELFNSEKVDYLIVGGYALAFHGAPRFTGDLDLYVRPDRENAGRILRALECFGFGSLGLTADDFIEPERVVQLGLPPVRIDILTSLTGVSWNDAWLHRANGAYGGVPVFFIGKTQLVINKKALSRHRDLADIEALGLKPDEITPGGR
ncbi:MAG: hypothetical protein RDV48_21690 [Candidatus Eremiobacteraeota bacterium]|nr:hypothetical protein [Candidatus Eremiobacteraeota bacterium]